MHSKKACLAALLLFASTSVLASNYTFLNYSAMAYFTGQDKDMMLANTLKALDHARDGAKLTWKNPATNAWGYAIPSHTTRTNGLLCRNVTLFNEANQISGSATYKFCKKKNQWEIVT